VSDKSTCVEKVEAVAAAMRAALEQVQEYLPPIHEITNRHNIECLCVDCENRRLHEAIDAALTSTAGQGWLSPEQAAELRAAEAELAKANTPFNDIDPRIVIYKHEHAGWWEWKLSDGGFTCGPYSTWREAYRAAEKHFDWVDMKQRAEAAEATLAVLKDLCEASNKNAIAWVHYRDMVDQALGQPRDLVPGQELLSQHLTAIARLQHSAVGGTCRMLSEGDKCDCTLFRQSRKIEALQNELNAATHPKGSKNLPKVAV